MLFKLSLRAKRILNPILFTGLLGFSFSAFASLGASVTVANGQSTDIYPGENTALQITLSNSSTASQINLVSFNSSLQGNLPDGLKVSGAATYICTDPSSGFSSTGSGSLNAANGSQSISLNGGVIPARANGTDGVCIITVPITAGTSNGSSATYTYTLSNGSVTGDDGSSVANSGDVNQSINVRSIFKPTILKSFADPELILKGPATTMTIVVNNPNSIPINNFTLSDTFPNIIKIAATPNVNSTCSSGGNPSVNVVAGSKSLSFSGNLPANGSCTLHAEVDGDNTSGNHSSTENNTINGNSDFTSDIGITSESASAQITVKSPLRVEKTVDKGDLSSGNSSFFTITLLNDGATPLTANFTDSPIDQFTGGGGLSVTSATTTCSGGVVNITSGNEGIQFSNGIIPAKAGSTAGSCIVTINFIATARTANSANHFTNEIFEGTVNVDDPSIVNSYAGATTTIHDNFDIGKDVSPHDASPGNPVRYKATVLNWNFAPLTNTVITDQLTNGQTFLNGIIGGFDYSPSLYGSCSGVSTSSAVGSSTAIITIANIEASFSPDSPRYCDIYFWAMTSPSAANGSNYQNILPANSVCNGSSCNADPSGTTYGTITAPVLTVTKTYSNASSLPEGTIRTVTFTLTNNSANPLTSATLNDNLQASQSGIGQLKVANPANVSTNCGGSPVITAAPNSTSIAMSGAIIPARANNGLDAVGSCYINVDVVGGAGTYQNFATSTATETYANGNTSAVGPVTSNTATIVYDSTLSASKFFTPNTTSSGGVSRVDIRLSNSGSTSITGVSVTDPLPNGMVISNPSNAYTTCAGTTAISAAAGSSSISLSGATILGNGSCDLVFNVSVTGTSNWVNTIPAGSISANGGIVNQSPVSATLTYSSGTGLNVAKATNPSTLTFPGQVSRLTITISNGNQPVTNLHLTDYFTLDGLQSSAPNGMIIASTPSPSTTCLGGLVSATPNGTSASISGVSMSANSACTYSVNVTSVSIGGITNYIPPASIINQQGFSNAGQATTSLTTQGNIGVVKKFTPNVIKPGDKSRLRITFYNPTNQSGTSLSVIDNLPANVTIASSPNATTTCSGATVVTSNINQVQVTGGTISATSGSLISSCYAEVDVTSSAQGDYINTINANAANITIGGTLNTNSQPTSDTLRVRLPIVIHKAFSNKTLDAGNPLGLTSGSDTKTIGASSVLTVILRNPNSSNLTSTAFTDYLPSGLVLSTSPSASTTCSNGQIDALSSGTSFRITGATIPASGQCTITLNVLSNIAGSYTNTLNSGDVTTAEGVTNDTQTSARIFFNAPPSVRKQFSPAVISAGGKSSLTIFLENPNASTETLTSDFVDAFPTAPSNLVVASPANIEGTCTTASVTANSGSGFVLYGTGAIIPSGGCYITVDVTSSVDGDYHNNIPTGTLTTDSGVNQSPANATLSIGSSGYISGKVFNDNNAHPDGIYDQGTDTPIINASVTLHAGNDCSSAIYTPNGTALTDSLGNYLFSNLPFGTYSLCQSSQPSGTLNGITSAGQIISNSGSTGAIGTASNPTTTSSQIVRIVLGDNGAGSTSGSVNNNFAEVIPSTISGRVFLDLNNNGSKDNSDVAISGVPINLMQGSTLIASINTDALGNYSFGQLAPGTYSIIEPTQPANTSNGITTAGSVSNGGTQGSVSSTSTSSSINNIVLPPNTAASENNFGEIQNGRGIYGRVFFDFNNNGVFDGSDNGIASQVINLTGTDINANAVTRTTTTDSQGNYNFTGLPEGTYIISQPNQPANTTNGLTITGSTGGVATNQATTPSQISSIDLTALNTASVGNNFAENIAPSPDLTITKTHSPASMVEGSSNGIFTITPRNIGPVDSSGVITVVDNLPAGITLAATATGTGWICLGSADSSSITCTSNQVIPASGTGSSITLRVSVATATAGQTLVNSAVISGGNEPAQLNSNNTATDSVSIIASAHLSGSVWLDLNHNRIRDSGESNSTLISGWTVELMSSGSVVATATTNSYGAYNLTSITPGSGYTLRFRSPSNGIIWGSAVTNESGLSINNGVRDSASVVSGTNIGNPAGATINGNGELNNFTLLSGDNIVQQSLPLDPAGVVYDSIKRTPVNGAVVTITGPPSFAPSSHLVSGNASYTTGADGMYQFLLTPSAPAGTYTLSITSYPSGYTPTESATLPACLAQLNVGSLPNPALVQNTNTAPSLSAPIHNPSTCPSLSSGLSASSGSTQYYFKFTINPASSADIVNNNIPIDPILGGAIVMTKRSPLINVSRGDLVPYTLTATNTLSNSLVNIDIKDEMPSGFKYKTGTASIDGVLIEPSLNSKDLTWSNLSFSAKQKREIKLMLIVGAGVSEGEYVNKTFAVNAQINSVTSNIATATVRVVPDPTFDCSDLIGKVFNDENANGYEDEGEGGIPNVRLATVNGLLVTTDDHGRFHVTCAMVPNEIVGSNFLMKLDERTLPTGFRITTENPRDVRLTRGKFSKLNFGASIHHVVRLDLSDEAFSSGDLKPEFISKLNQIIDLLKSKPSILRVSYKQGYDDFSIAEKRLKVTSDQIKSLWNKSDCCYQLQIEEEMVKANPNNKNETK